MSMYLSYTIEGGKELQEKLDLLKTEVADKVVKQSVMKCQKILYNEARVRASFIVGGNMGTSISNAIQIKNGKRKIRYSHYVSVSIKNDPIFRHKTKSGLRRVYKQGIFGRSVKYKKGDYYIPSAIEYGHVAQNGSFVRPKSFMRSSDSATKDIRINLFKEILSKRINSVWKKTNKKAGQIDTMMTEFASEQG